MTKHVAQGTNNNDKTQPTQATKASMKSILEEFDLPGENPSLAQEPHKEDHFKNLLDNLRLTSAPTSNLPDWMKDRTVKPVEKNSDVPEWLEEDDQDDELYDVPDWLKEHSETSASQDSLDDEGSFNQYGMSDLAEEHFNPNETQEVKAYNKQKRAYVTLVVIILYLAFTLFAGSFVGFRFDEMISGLLGFYLYTVAQERGYDLKFLLPHKK